jgi:putative ABC transport system permease protein
MIARLLATLRGLLRRRQIEREIDEELQDHLERAIEAHRSRGVSPEEARRLALRDLGGLTQTIEYTRDVRATWVDNAWRDVRYAARVLWRSPRFTVTALTLLVLGIGSTTAIVSIVYAVLVRPLPYPDAGGLVFIAEKGGNGVAWPNFQDWQRRATSFDGLASTLADAVIVTSGPVPRRFLSRSVTSNFFGVLGVPAYRGRLFGESDARPGAAATAVISHEFWMREFGGHPAAIGQQMTLRNAFTVIGVLPPGFRYMTQADVYLLLEPQVAANYRGMPGRGSHTSLYAVGRLKPTVSVMTARTEMQIIAAALALEYPLTNAGSDDVRLVPLAERIVGDMAPTLRVLAGGVTLLLLIACVNLAVLLLNKSASRAHEFSIRAAIGASRWTLIRQLLIEQGLLVVTGGVLGALAGAAILAGLISMAPPDMPRLNEIRLDLVVLAWTTLMSCACAFVFGALPALKASGIGGQARVVRSGRGLTRQNSLLRRSLLIGEVAVATVLLAGSGLMVHTMLRLSRVDPGFDPHNLQTVMFSLAGPAWPDPRKKAFFAEVVERLRAVPGVENAAITYSLPILGSYWWNWFTVAGRPVPPGAVMMDLPSAGMVPVSATYFETLKIPLIRGRSFDRSDTPESEPVAIINTSLVNLYWRNRGGDVKEKGPAFVTADEDPIGQQIRLAGGNPNEGYGPWRTIVGIVGDVKQHGLDQDTPQQIFMPVVQQTRTTVFAVARTKGTVSSSAIEAAIRDLDRSVPVFDDRTVEQVMKEASSRRRIAMIVLSVFGGVAVFLAAIGLYGVIAQSVAERRQEIGVRMALGATPGHVLRLFLRHGLIVVAVGIGCGIVAAVAAARTLKSLVFGVESTDPATLGTVAVLLTVVTLAASYMPARSATRVDPLEGLRSE